jgi:hypothetical protein
VNWRSAEPRGASRLKGLVRAEFGHVNVQHEQRMEGLGCAGPATAMNADERTMEHFPALWTRQETDG